MREMRNDDAKLTACAVGELQKSERAEVEKQLAASEELRREVEEIRVMDAALRQALATAPQRATRRSQQEADKSEVGRNGILRFPAKHPFLFTGGMAASTCLVIAMLMAFTQEHKENSVAPYIYTLLTEQQRESHRRTRYIDGGTEDLSIRAESAEFTTEAYDYVHDNPFILVAHDPRSTFSVDVDTASYSNVRRFLNGGNLPPKDAVRVEELINYFTYDYDPPRDGHPFAVHVEMARCPWNKEHRLVRIGVKGKELPRGERPAGNLVFLLDISGSMDETNKLPLVQSSMRLLVNELRPQDRVAIVVYAGAEGLALPSTSAGEKEKILDAIENLSAGGTTHGSAGLRLAYEIAEDSFVKGGVNRVILATDGDFNVGITSRGELIRLIEEKANSGVFLTVLGFGVGNINDSTLEQLADHGNGNYAYIDGLWEARKVLVEQIGATLVTIARDVKLQLEFNPDAVKAFRLIGYENRVLAHQDFNDDKKDAGDIGAGHAVTAFYEVVPVGAAIDARFAVPLKYQEPMRPSKRAKSNEVLTLKLRYKQPDASKSRLMEKTLSARDKDFEKTSTDFRFAASVAAFGMLLRESPYKGDASFAQTLAWAKASQGTDSGRLRAKFLILVEKARLLSSSQ
jgi:Ca-activated chloride channel family protein